MVCDGAEPKPPLTFEAWKWLLHKDCEVQDNLLAFQALGDDVLEIFWQRGLEPTVKAIIDDGAEDHIPPSRSGQGISGRPCSMLSETAVKELAKLVYQPDVEWLANMHPFGSVYWADEMPDIRKLIHQDRQQILAMFSIRLKVWDGEVLLADEARLWESIRDQAPSWPLFQRLSLTDQHKLARQEAERKVAEAIEPLPDGSEGE